MRIETIEKHLKRAESIYNFYTSAKELYDECASLDIGTPPEAIFRAYIITGAVDDAAKLLNEHGFTNGTRKFDSNAVSDTIRNTEISDTRLATISKRLLELGAQFYDRLYN